MIAQTRTTETKREILVKLALEVAVLFCLTGSKDASTSGAVGSSSFTRNTASGFVSQAWGCGS